MDDIIVKRLFNGYLLEPISRPYTEAIYCASPKEAGEELEKMLMFKETLTDPVET